MSGLRCGPLSLLVAIMLVPAFAVGAEKADASVSCHDPQSVIGVPHFDGDRGAIEVTSSAGRRLITRSSLGQGTSRPGDLFGAAVASSVSLREDACLDIMVGAPGAEGTGVVYLLRAAPSGGFYTRSVRLPHPQQGDRFGFSVSAGEGEEGSVSWAGAPGRDVEGHVDAGSVAHFDTGPSSPNPVAEEISQASPGVAGEATRGNQFGEVLSSPFFTNDGFAYRYLVVVGVPHADIGAAHNAGMVVVVQAEPWETGDREPSPVTQNGHGVPGAAESGDQFGASLAQIYGSVYGSWIWAVGAPGEDVGSVKDAGLVTFFTELGDPDYGRIGAVGIPEYAVTQNSARVPGRAQAGGRFGESLAPLRLCEPSSASFVIGAPGDSVKGRTGAGAAVVFDSGLSGRDTTLWSEPVAPKCPSRWLRQGGRAPGHAEVGDHFGTQISVAGEDLMISAPGEDRDRNQIVNTGVVDLLKLPSLTPQVEQTFTGGPRRDLRYGVLPSQ